MKPFVFFAGIIFLSGLYSLSNTQASQDTSQPDQKKVTEPLIQKQQQCDPEKSLRIPAVIF